MWFGWWLYVATTPRALGRTKKCVFLRIQGPFFILCTNFLKKFRKKISGDLRVIWPPQQTVIFYIENSAIKYGKVHKTRKLAVFLEFQMHFPFQINFSHDHDMMLLHFKRFYPHSSSSRFPWGVKMVEFVRFCQFWLFLPPHGKRESEESG